MKILIAGGSGYIGTNTLIELLKFKHDIEVLDNLSNGFYSNIYKKTKFNNLNLNDYDSINHFLSNNYFDIVMHFAGSIDIKESLNNPKKYYKNNYLSSLNLINAMIKNNMKKLIFSSSAAVYGDGHAFPIKEINETNPLSSYGKTKLMVENTLNDYDKAYGLKSISLRYFNACGAQLDGTFGEKHIPENHIIPLLMQVASKKLDKFYIFGNNHSTDDGTCVRDYVHVIDIADAHIKSIKYLFEENKSNIFNIGNNKGFSVMELLSHTEKITNMKINYEITKARLGDPAILISDNYKIKEILNWSPNYSDLSTILKTAWLWENKSKQ